MKKSKLNSIIKRKNKLKSIKQSFYDLVDEELNQSISSKSSSQSQPSQSSNSPK